MPMSNQLRNFVCSAHSTQKSFVVLRIRRMTSSLEQLSALAVVKLSELPCSMEKSAEFESKDQTPEKISIVGESMNQSICTAPTMCTTNPLAGSNSNRCQPEWSRNITLDERKFIRDKIKAAYLKKISNSFEDLLETCAAIQEELVFSSAPSRLDYFKTGVQFEKKVAEKRSELKSNAFEITSSCASTDSNSDNQSRPFKRAKTNH